MQCLKHISASDGAGIGGTKMGYLPGLPGRYCGVWNSTFYLNTDASRNNGIGAVLSQKQGEVERVIAYGSRSLTKAERNYCATRRELLALSTSCATFVPT